jgi:hypothetical protein
MSLIDDVAASLAALDVSRRSLRRFAWVAGGALGALALLFAALGRHPVARDILGAVAVALVLSGALAPERLGTLHRAWMALAFALGWVVSRLVLALAFFLAVTPLALLARATGKRFLDLDLDPSAPSYWVRRAPGRPARYDRMF